MGIANVDFDLSAEEAKSLNDWLKRFNQSWTSEQLNSFLRQLPSAGSRLRTPILLGIVQLDLQRHWESGQPVAVENYLQAYPELRDQDNLALAMIQKEFLVRRKLGAPMSVAQFASRFPQWAGVIREWEKEKFETVSLRPSSHETAHHLEGDSPGHKKSSFDKTLQLSNRFGRYEIIRRLGAGGMGTVFLARDSELDREVALKMPKFSDEEDLAKMAARFKQEARAAAKLSHPHICSLLDVGQVDGIYYLTMPYIEGESLAEKMKRRSEISTTDAITLVIQVARALEYAHRHGVVHRDIKPSNIMINQQGQPIIMDFGLALSLEPKATRLTKSGEAIGTLVYMPPEQLRAELNRMGPCSDIYSLGVILYELIAGRLPFDGSTAEIVVKVLTEDPKPLPGDKQLDAACRKAISRDPSRRYASMADFADALEEFVCEESVAGPFDSTLVPLPVIPVQSQASRKKTWIVTALVILGVFAGGAAAYRFMHWHPDDDHGDNKDKHGIVSAPPIEETPRKDATGPTKSASVVTSTKGAPGVTVGPKKSENGRPDSDSAALSEIAKIVVGSRGIASSPSATIPTQSKVTAKNLNPKPAPYFTGQSTEKTKNVQPAPGPPSPVELLPKGVDPLPAPPAENPERRATQGSSNQATTTPGVPSLNPLFLPGPPPQSPPNKK